MIHIRSAGEIEKISKACQIVKETLDAMSKIRKRGKFERGNSGGR